MNERYQTRRKELDLFQFQESSKNLEGLKAVGFQYLEVRQECDRTP